MLIYNYVQIVFKPFKNHKNQRSQIMLDFILKIYNLLNIKPDRYFFTPNKLSYVGFHIENLQSAEYQTGSIFFHHKIVQLYIIMYFYIIQTVFNLFKNNKNQRSQIVLNFILKILQSAKSQIRINIFFTSKQLSYI